MDFTASLVDIGDKKVIVAVTHDELSPKKDMSKYSRKNKLETQVKKSSEEETSIGRKCVLLIEDNEIIRDNIVNFLHTDFDVIAPHEMSEAIKNLEKFSDMKIDLLISDVIMPEISGPQFAQELLKKNPNLKILFISGYTDSLKNCELIPEQVAFLAKPFSANTLLKNIKVLFETKKVLKPQI